MPNSRDLVYGLLFLCVSWLTPTEASAETWGTTSSTDEMSGEVYANAYSPPAYPTPATVSTFNNLRAYLVYGCNEKGGQSLVVRFETPPNLNDVEITGQRDRFETRVRWDDDPVLDHPMSHRWGRRDVFFEQDTTTPLYDENGERRTTFYQRVQTHEHVLVEFDVYMAGRTVYRFTLDGSSAAIAEARDICGAWPG